MGAEFPTLLRCLFMTVKTEKIVLPELRIQIVGCVHSVKNVFCTSIFMNNSSFHFMLFILRFTMFSAVIKCRAVRISSPKRSIVSNKFNPK